MLLDTLSRFSKAELRLFTPVRTRTDSLAQFDWYSESVSLPFDGFGHVCPTTRSLSVCAGVSSSVRQCNGRGDWLSQSYRVRPALQRYSTVGEEPCKWADPTELSPTVTVDGGHGFAIPSPCLGPQIMVQKEPYRRSIPREGDARHRLSGMWYGSSTCNEIAVQDLSLSKVSVVEKPADEDQQHWTVTPANE